MGVPKFAAWLTKKYPEMVEKTCPSDVHGLYVDLNGLIHPCCHDEKDPSVALRPEAEKLRQICLAVEVLVVTTKPQHVLYIAIDGVAPRAKMNQQRARRYMSSARSLLDQHSLVAALEKEFTEEARLKAELELEKTEKELLEDPLYGGGVSAAAAADGNDNDSEPASTGGLDVLPGVDVVAEPARRIFSRPPPPHHAEVPAEAEDGAKKFDSNCISPGTDFMTKVAVEMRTFIAAKLQNGDPLWKNLNVVFSDANSPGEGEHKLIDFIRTQSSFPGFNGHGAHVLAGLDADLIFLSLSLHIPGVFLLRDNKRPSSFEQKKQKKKQTNAKSKPDALAGGEAASVAGDSGSEEEEDNDDDDDIEDDDGTLLSASPAAAVEVESNLTYEYYDIDIVGNSWVSEIYQLCLAKGYAFDAAGVDRDTESCLYTVSNGYDFSRFAGSPSGEKKDTYKSVATFEPCTLSFNSKVIDDLIVMAMIMGNDFLPRVPSAFCGESVMDSLMEMYVAEVLPHGYLTRGNHEIDLRQLKRFFYAYAKVEAMKFRQFCIADGLMTPEEAAAPLGSEKDNLCWRGPYYRTTSIKEDGIREACSKYVEGLRFVWRYYSCTSIDVSWSWYFPFHHGPFAIDLAAYLDSFGAAVQTAVAAPPVERVAPTTAVQLLCILPPTSRALVPEVLRETMTAPPPELRETFPLRWDVDYAASYGKDHLATVMLPFANMQALTALVTRREADFTPAEQQRQLNTPFHLLFRRRDRERARGGEAYTFTLRGVTAAPLEAGAVGWAAPEACGDAGDVELLSFADVAPEPCRTRTYSYTVPIPNLTVMEGGQLFRAPRRPRGAAWVKKDTHSGTVLSSSASVAADSKSTDKKRKKASAGDAGADAPSVVREPPAFSEIQVVAGAAAVFAVVIVAPLACGAQLQMLAVALTAVFLAFFLNSAVPFQGKVKGGALLRRNSVRFTYVDWQCPLCLSHNFARNTRCFICDAPFDNSKAWATFQGKNPPDPPLMDPFHDKYCEPYGIDI